MAEQVANIEGLGMVRLIFRNNLKGSMFNFHVDVAYKANENLLYYLDRSVEINKDLRMMKLLVFMVYLAMFLATVTSRKIFVRDLLRRQDTDLSVGGESFESGFR
ncbi:uncharacterized protein LOC106061406 isoform X3 [Biomphalaria glabrata]|uniref:Uncharacterized protein LOC106061406 isoform X3 n=1 Tax=Biomphalaria glabrata TaxID=6526 RepID=A0A9W2YSW2_BIOGL|nr:uncharacterized protein LOC106061406 isoform X3 [Biomphalaria glabrata]